jgi:hypothetical protein
MTRRPWLVISRTVTLMREHGYDGSRRTLERRLEQWDREADGRLLRWTGAPKSGGKREVNPVILLQFLTTDPVERARELDHLHERIDIIDGRTKAMRDRLKIQGKTISTHENRLNKHERAMRLVAELQRVLAEP